MVQLKIDKKIMQHTFFLLLFLMTNLCLAQPPSGYYSSATGTGYTLKTQLKNIISNGHTDQGYGALYDAYETSDTDSFYENDNSVLDMYSENPSGDDPYNFQHKVRNCGGSPNNNENSCYNREHIFPQGFFNSQNPMRTDIHHVVPSDYYVNQKRSSFPFGEVTSASWTSNNGSKIGVNIFGSFNGTVFEPIDEFKGDIARMLFYFATRYEDNVTDSSWDDPNASSNNPLNGTNNQVYDEWYIQLLYKWHLEDPVSQREIVRNNEAYNFQGNRNPFIDHPEYIAEIWSTVLSSKNYSVSENIIIYPNPSAINKISITIPNEINLTKIAMYSIIGRKVYEGDYTSLKKKTIKINNLKSGIYLLKIAANNKSISKKIIIQ